jgi:catechol 2,3-dioxygenase
MAELSPLWSARLDHLCLTSPNPEAMIGFYRDALGMNVTETGLAAWRIEGPGRRLLLRGDAGAGLDFAGFAVADDARLLALRAHIEAQGGELTDNPSPFYQQGGFAVRDPDGNQFCFGVVENDAAGDAIRDVAAIGGRLQHVVVASADLQAMMTYYEQVLGFLPSDYVRADDGAISAAFYRSDDEHHSFAVFRAPESRLDHHAYETPSWNHIRDWADHLSTLEIPIWWGPGRHGVGNNLFFMVEDPDGNKVEFSSEIEEVGPEVIAREWPHGPRALNLWGPAWMRS